MPPRARSAGGARLAPALLLAPSCLTLLAVFLLPIGLVLSRSMFDQGFTLQYYSQMLGTPVYLQIFWNTFVYALLSTVLALALSYPVAYALARVQGTWRAILLLCILLPFWTNILVRCYAWILVLQVRGAVNLTLVDWLNLSPAPLPLVFNSTGAMIGMVHYLMPIAILVLEAGMRRVDGALIQVASSMGARPWRAFIHVFLPQTFPALQAAAVLTFINALGAFVIPALLGGRKDTTIAMLIAHEFFETMNWGFGAALAAGLLVSTLMLLGTYYALKPRIATA